MEFIASIDRLHEMLEWIGGQLAPMGFDSAVLHKVELASEEALVNIVNHAHQGLTEKVEIQVNFFPESHAEIVFKDHGPRFNPLDATAVDQDLPIDQMQIGGLGIHLMRKCVDEILYSYAEGKNVLTFVIRSSQKR